MAKLLNAIVVRVCAAVGVEPTKLSRNLKQTQIGGFDLDGIDWIAIEIKHHKQVSLGAWWMQCCRQAGPQPAGTFAREPVLIWKQHGGKWNVRMFSRIRINPGSDVLAEGDTRPPSVVKARWLRVVSDVSMADFLVWFEKRLEVEIRNAL